MTKAMMDSAVVRDAVELACRAPSLHNSQPWQWVATDTVVDLFADPHRIVHSVDDSGREAVISCGVALDHFRVAMGAMGWDTNVDLFPNPNNPNHLASIDFTSLDYVSEARRERAAAITHRRTDRLPFRAPKDWVSIEPVLRNSFDSELATLDVLADDARPKLAEAAQFSETLRRYDDLYHHELSWWTSPSREHEGVPPSALVSGSEARRVDVNRRFPTSGTTERRSSTPHDQAKILVLSTADDTPADALNCGQALSAVLLDCTMAGLATCPLSHITEMEQSRNVIRNLIARPAAMPQVLIRVGTAPASTVDPPLTPRRPLDDVLQIRR